MEHEDFEQVETTIDGQFGRIDIYITLCTCGKAFWSDDSDAAYAKWEQHEAEVY